MRESNILFDNDLETSVIGAILLEKIAIARVGPLFRPEMFYKGQNEIIAKAIVRLYKAGIPIDLITVFDEVKKAGNGAEITPYELSRFTNSVVSTAHLEAHMMKLAELYMCREVQKMAATAYGQSGDRTVDPFDLIVGLQTQLTNLLAGTAQGGLIGMDRLITGTLKYIESIKPGVISGVTTGINTLDQIFYGWKAPDLIVLAARPACGKTAFSLQVQREAASMNIPSGLFSLEMNTHQINQRHLAAKSGIHFAKIIRNQLTESEWYQLNQAAAELAKLPIFIDDSFSQNIQVIHSKCTQMKFRHGLGFVIVDYLQLIGSAKQVKGQLREQAISEISRGLKGIAKDLNVPVLALSQMSRDIEKGGRKEPMLSDLRESGAIEQDADIVMFLTPEEEDQDSVSNSRRIKVKIAKHRNGVKAPVELDFNGNFQRFSEAYTSLPNPGNWKPITNFSEPIDGPF